MSQSRETPISLLKQKNFYARQWKTFPNGSTWYYMTYKNDVDGVVKLLNSATVQTILGTDEHKQNAMHYVLSNKLFNYAEDRKKDYSGQFTPVNTVLTPPGFVSVETLTQPRPETLKTATEFVDEQKKNVYRIVDALVKPFEDKGTPLEIERLLTSKDSNGSTVLHCGYGSLTYRSFNFVNKLLPKLSPQVRMSIGTIRDKAGQNIFHKMASGWDLETYDNAVKIYGIDVAREAIYMKDNKDNTGFHFVCSTLWKTSDKIKQLEAFIALEDKANKANHAILSRNTDGRNVLHVACAQVGNEKNVTLCETLKKQLLKTKELDYFNALKMQDNKGYTPLHHACATGKTDVVQALLGDDTLTPQQKAEIASIETPSNAIKNGVGLLELACQHGDKHMLRLVFDALTPTRACELMETRKAQLEKLIAANKNLHITDLDEMMESHNVLMMIYRYLSKKKPSEALNQRRDDFCQSLFDKIMGKILLTESKHDFKAKNHVFFKGSEEYLTMRRAMERSVTQMQAKQFLGFICDNNQYVQVEPMAVSIYDRLRDLYKGAGFSEAQLLSSTTTTSSPTASSSSQEPFKAALESSNDSDASGSATLGISSSESTSTTSQQVYPSFVSTFTQSVKATTEAVKGLAGWQPAGPKQ